MSQEDVARRNRNLGRNLASVAAGTKFATDNTAFVSMTPDMQKRAAQAGICDAGAFARRLGMGFSEFFSSGIIPPADINDGKLKFWKRETVEAFAKRLGR